MDPDQAQLDLHITHFPEEVLTVKVMGTVHYKILITVASFCFSFLVTSYRMSLPRFVARCNCVCWD